MIATSDRDAFALIDETTTVLRIINGGADASPIMTADRLVTLLGVHPSQYRDFAALRGDPSDNLPGVRGIGPQTAARLLCEFGSAAAAFDDLDAVRARLGAGVAKRLAEPRPRVAVGAELPGDGDASRSSTSISICTPGRVSLPLDARRSMRCSARRT